MRAANAANPRHYARQWMMNAHECCCPVCGLLYVKDSENDRRIHRARHRKVLQVYEPKPMAALAACYAKHGSFLQLDSHSPRLLRQRLADMAMMFRRELGFDFAPYEATEDYDEPSHHWLIISANGRAIGGMSARWRIYSDAPAQWVWAWAWVIPAERRGGHTQRCWDMLRAKIPGIKPEPPFSYPIAKFFAERSDVSERIRAIAARTAKAARQKQS